MHNHRREERTAGESREDGEPEAADRHRWIASGQSDSAHSLWVVPVRHAGCDRQPTDGVAGHWRIREQWPRTMHDLSPQRRACSNCGRACAVLWDRPDALGIVIGRSKRRDKNPLQRSQACKQINTMQRRAQADLVQVLANLRRWCVWLISMLLIFGARAAAAVAWPSSASPGALLACLPPPRMACPSTVARASCAIAGNRD